MALADTSVPVACVAVLFLVHFILASSMSFLRLKKLTSSKKSDEAEEAKRSAKQIELRTFFGSFFERFHGVQLLHSEWGTWITIMFLYAHFQSLATGVAVGGLTSTLMVVLTATRCIFPLRPFMGRTAYWLSPLTMFVCYSSFLALIPLVFLA
eukprot:m.37528 g.37528  ORF g.37528 m.37528 type:complete len:153 (-) comp45062_c0_seq1:58-516(-)